MTEIEKVTEAEVRNYQISSIKFEGSVKLVQMLVDSYKTFGKLIEDSRLPPSDEVLSLTHFLLACRYQLVVGAISIMRGHLNDSYIFTRKAIEHCAFAARVVKHPHLATIWVNSADTNEAYKKYKKKFSPGKIFPEDHKALGELYNRYDLCAKFSHPSIYSFAGHLGTNINPSKVQFTFDYFQVRDDDHSEPIRTLLWTIDTHFGILNVFLEQLSTFKGFLKDKALDILRNVQVHMDLEKGKYESIILNT